MGTEGKGTDAQNDAQSDQNPIDWSEPVFESSSPKTHWTTLYGLSIVQLLTLISLESLVNLCILVSDIRGRLLIWTWISEILVCHLSGFYNP